MTILSQRILIYDLSTQIHSVKFLYAWCRRTNKAISIINLVNRRQYCWYLTWPSLQATSSWLILDPIREWKPLVTQLCQLMFNDSFFYSLICIPLNVSHNSINRVAQSWKFYQRKLDLLSNQSCKYHFWVLLLSRL